MSIIEVEALAKTFKTRERAAGLSGSLHSSIAPRYRQREAVKPISFSLEPGELLALLKKRHPSRSSSIGLRWCLGEYLLLLQFFPSHCGVSR